MHNFGHALWLQMHFGPAANGVVVAPFGTLSKHARGFVPNAVVAFVGNELSGGWLAVDEFGVVVDMQLVAALQHRLGPSQSPCFSGSGQPNRAALHGFFDVATAEFAMIANKIDHSNIIVGDFKAQFKSVNNGFQKWAAEDWSKPIDHWLVKASRALYKNRPRLISLAYWKRGKSTRYVTPAKAGVHLLTASWLYSERQVGGFPRSRE